MVNFIDKSHHERYYLLTHYTILNYKILPVSTKIVIFREKCSKLINILMEFIAVFYGIYETEKINFRELKIIIIIIDEVLFWNFNPSVTWRVQDELSSSCTQEISRRNSISSHGTIRSCVVSRVQCYKSLLIIITSSKQFKWVDKVINLPIESWFLIDNHEKIYICIFSRDYR